MLDAVADALDSEIEQTPGETLTPQTEEVIRRALAHIESGKLTRDAVEHFLRENPKAAKRCHDRFLARVLLIGGKAVLLANRPRASAPSPAASTGCPFAAWDETTLERAREQHKPVLLFFHADWAGGASRRLITETFRDERLSSVFERDYVTACVDVTDNESMSALDAQRRFRVVGLPTILVFDEQGRERARIVDFVSPDELAELLSGP